MKANSVIAGMAADGCGGRGELAAQIERNSAVRVVMLIPDHAEDQHWADFTAEQFLQGYADTDAIYDDVSTG